MAKKKKIRTDFRKNRAERTRQRDLTRRFATDDEPLQDIEQNERISGKGDLVRKRTVVVSQSELATDEPARHLEVDEATTLRGRVLSVHGLTSTVQDEHGNLHHCAARRLLKTLSTDQRHIIAAGDRVVFRLDGHGEGMIERVEPRYSVLSRTSRGRQHIIATNVDSMFVVASSQEPPLKPNLIDRMLITAEKGGVRPGIVINKVDLVELADLQPLVGVYSRMGYPVLLVSARTGFGIERFRKALVGKASVVVGQSGVGKSSLLNTVDPTWELRVSQVSTETQKGRHTTTAARLLPLTTGGWVLDTPGMRQFQLWDVIPEEVAGYFRDLRPYESLCRFPNCTHTHEVDCAVKDAVADGWLDARRYESYCLLFEGDDEMAR